MKLAAGGVEKSKAMLQLPESVTLVNTIKINFKLRLQMIISSEFIVIY